jgi:hypothetical protein
VIATEILSGLIPPWLVVPGAASTRQPQDRKAWESARSLVRFGIRTGVHVLLFSDLDGEPADETVPFALAP